MSVGSRLQAVKTAKDFHQSIETNPYIRYYAGFYNYI